MLQGSSLQARQWLFTDLCLPSPKAVTTPFTSFSLLVQQHAELEQLTNSAEHLPLPILITIVRVIFQVALEVI